MHITEIRDTKWRDELLPATFRQAEFHCENNAWEGGRRIVEHQFPKRDMPYAEDMGRQAATFTIRGYCIAYPYDLVGGDSLYRRDYRFARNALQRELDIGGPGILQLPTMKAMWVVCPRYRLQEEERRGGYCIFEMEFQEFGLDPPRIEINPLIQARNRAKALRVRIMQILSPEFAPYPPTTADALGPLGSAFDALVPTQAAPNLTTPATPISGLLETPAAANTAAVGGPVYKVWVPGRAGVGPQGTPPPGWGPDPNVVWVNPGDPRLPPGPEVGMAWAAWQEDKARAAEAQKQLA
jgi:hypothetical protein